MRRTIERMLCKIGHKQKLVISGVALAAALLVFFSAMLSLDVVTVMERDGTSRTILTADKNTQGATRLAGVKATRGAELVYTAYSDDGMSILIDRKFSVAVQADGAQLEAVMESGTVAEALAACGVQLEGDDFVEPGLETEVYRNMQVSVSRVSYQERTARNEVLREDVDSFLAQNAETIDADSFTYSKSRIYDVTYRDTLINGEVAESELVALQAVYHPYDAPSESFEANVPVSTIDSFVGVELDENGIPVNYTRKMESAVATAYSSSGGKGAGGQGLYCGTVAVNPNVIAYGTRLYIRSADGRFVYGYAIASDCGTAMMEGYVDVDLYFESNAECRRFGKRALDIYILD